MKNSRRAWHLTIVNLVVGIAILMVLSALIIPVFVPPDGRAASRAALHAASAKPVKR
jgi:type II secretory pathway pseudopilin PulG